MDPRKLLYFASVIENGSLKRGAKALSISQPTLSESMDRLEESLGVKLLERGSKGVIPTQKGEVLYTHARLIRDELARAEREIKTPQPTTPQTVVFGALPSLACSVVPMALAKWRERHPDTQLQFVERTQVDLLLDLVHREVDFIVGHTDCYDMLEGLMQRVLFRDHLCVLARPGHPVLDLDDVSWSTLVQFPWVCAIAGRYRGFLDTLLQSQGLPPPGQVTQCGSVVIVKSLVAGSDSFALLPAYAVHEELVNGTLQRVPIDMPELDRNIAVFFREGFVLDEQRRELIANLASAGSQLARQPDSPGGGQVGDSKARLVAERV
ncbi:MULTISPECIES: LysR family transcriptional regulator [unclassified Mesorhizobium]|uniref:LysR family transcriptional regulator n=1 Tax=unclassified Mesorhizobium TaxID=325217 RepID=UPI001FE01D68|nr:MULTISPECIES: LysR family transcriptional regulator [unclassified Mesorhizobium]